MCVAKLKELQSARDGDGAVGGDSEATSQVPDARRTLILDLSSKVTEQETEIIHLRELLRKNNLSPDDATTVTLAESSSMYSDTDWRHRLHLPSHHQKSGTDSSGSYGMVEERSDRLTNGEGVSPTGKSSIGKTDYSLSRTSQGPVERSLKCSSKQEKSTTPYRAHWASSCFDVDDLSNDGAG